MPSTEVIVLIRIGEDGKVQDAKFLTFGCGSAIASSSYATELVKGKTLEDYQPRYYPSPIKKHCSLLAEEALKKAIEDYRRQCKRLYAQMCAVGGSYKRLQLCFQDPNGSYNGRDSFF
jgi:hypothetical protein